MGVNFISSATIFLPFQDMTFKDPSLSLIHMYSYGITDSARPVVFPNDHLIAPRPAEPMILIVLGRPFNNHFEIPTFHFHIVCQADFILYICQAL